MSKVSAVSLPTTGLYAGALGLGFAAFSLNVGLTRVSELSAYLWPRTETVYLRVTACIIQITKIQPGERLTF